MPKASIQTQFHRQSCYPPNQDATDLILFALWLCKRMLEQIPFCTCHNPNPKTLSSSQLLPTNKDCACTPPEAELHKLRVLHSARTVHAQCTLQCTPQCTATTHCKYHGIERFFDKFTKKMQKYMFFFCVFCIILGQIRGIYSVLWPCTVACTVACTVRALYVHCAKHDVCAPLYFHQQNAAILLLEACRHILH